MFLAPLSKYNKKPLPKGKVTPCENLIQAPKTPFLQLVPPETGMRS